MEKRLAYLGPAGTFSEAAAIAYDPSAVRLPVETVHAVAQAVEADEADEGVVAIENSLDEAPNIARPLMLHMAEKDQFVLPEAQVKITETLAPNSHVTLHKYAGMDHAFARAGGQHYDQTAADLANQRSRDFLTQHLGT